MDYQAYPRLTAMAETAWTPKDRKDLADFRHRLAGFLARLDRLGVHYAPLQEAEPARIKQIVRHFFDRAAPDQNCRLIFSRHAILPIG